MLETPTPIASPAQQQFVALLRDMFQIEDLDLDFGIYRVLRQERTLIQNFLNERIGPLTREAFGVADDTVRAAKLEELNRKIATRRDDGYSDEEIEKAAAIIQLRADLAAMPDSSALENEVYNGLAEFFGRYYVAGDFLSRPRYKKDVYALPYNGEEVKLHWANRDQYYIKSAQVLEAFEWNCNGQKVRFQLRDAGTATDNNKEERRFVLALDDDGNPVVYRDGDLLVVEFDFKKEPGGPKDLNADADKRLREWNAGAGLTAPILAPYNDKKSHFLHRLNSWTARGSFDFFVHKDLRGFLTRELDFYLKNEVLQLDALFGGDAAVWEKTTLAKARAMHALGGKIIEFLSGLEDLQKRLWEKQKWVTGSRAILPLSLIPAALLPDVLNNRGQIEEWQALYGIEAEPISTVNTVAWSEPPSMGWAEQHGNIAVDTRHFDTAWTRRLWSELSNQHDSLDNLWNGVLWNADNFAALNLMQKRFAEQVKCAYIDPPYNTNASEILYKNGYRSSSWITMIENRVLMSKPLLCKGDGIICVTIDDYQVHELALTLDAIFDREAQLGVAVIRINPSGRSTLNGFSVCHEYAFFYGREATAKLDRFPRTQEQLERFTEIEEGYVDWRNFRKDGGAVTHRKERPKQFYPIYVDKKKDTLRVPQMLWNDSLREWTIIESPAKNEEIILPIDEKGKERVWSYNHVSATDHIDELEIRTSKDGRTQVYRRHTPSDGVLPRSWWDKKTYAAREYGSAELSNLFGNSVFAFAKSPYAVQDCIWAAGLGSDPDALVLDYFAGSGTTGHAVINLNRADGEEGQRKFVLVEMGQYFDSVLVPRLKKAAFADKWRDGRPADWGLRNGVAQTLFAYRLESYEDALEHLAAAVEADGQPALQAPDDDWTVRYAIGAATHDGELPLSNELFAAPFDIKMKVGGDSVGQSRTVNPDAIATFNWMLGLRVHKLWFTGAAEAPQLAAVCGLLPDDRAVVVVWRQLAGVDYATADATLLDFWRHDPLLAAWRAEHEVQVVYVNGDSTLGTLKAAGETWVCEPLEQSFRNLMFATSPRREAF